MFLYKYSSQATESLEKPLPLQSIMNLKNQEREREREREREKERETP